jgi:hypothetical protein
MNRLLSRIKVTLRTEEQHLNVAMPPKKEVEPDIDHTYIRYSLLFIYFVCCEFIVVCRIPIFVDFVDNLKARNKIQRKFVHICIYKLILESHVILYVF